MPHLSFAEGGQSSTGRLLVWLRDLVSGEGKDEKVSYNVLDEEASKIAPGSDGLVALETWYVANQKMRYAITSLLTNCIIISKARL